MTRLRSVILLTAALSLGAAPLYADVIVQFNEVGAISYSTNSGISYVPLPDGIVEADPTGGVAGDVLVYNLTSILDDFELLNGDVPISSDSELIGDLRFTDTGGSVSGGEECGVTQCLMIFYVFDNNGLSADVGDISTSFLTTQTPDASLSGDTFSYVAGTITYQGTIVPETGPVPEPASLWLLLSGLGLSAFFLRRNKSTQQG